MDSVDERARLIRRIVDDMRTGKRTREILSSRNLTIPQLSTLLKNAIAEGFISFSEYKAWKEHGSISTSTVRLVASVASELDEPAERSRRVVDQSPIIAQIVEDMRCGKRTQEILSSRNLTKDELAKLVRIALRDGLISSDELKAWKERRPISLSTVRLAVTIAAELNEPVERIRRRPEVSSKVLEIVEDIRSGKRTREILSSRNLKMDEAARLLRTAVSQGLISTDELKAWKERNVSTVATVRLAATVAAELDEPVQRFGGGMETFIIPHHAIRRTGAVKLFRGKAEEIKGTELKVGTGGSLTTFVVNGVLFRGIVPILDHTEENSESFDSKCNDAADYIAEHGWSAYLEARVFAANFDTGRKPPQKGRLALVHGKEENCLAALMTAEGNIKVIVGPSPTNVVDRLSVSIDKEKLSAIRNRWAHLGKSRRNIH